MADIRNNFVGIKSPNPFWLASAPPTDKAYNVERAYAAGWGGVVWKTLGEEGPPVVNVNGPRYGAIWGADRRLLGLNNIELITDRPLQINLQEMKAVKKKWRDRALIASIMVPCEEDAWKAILPLVEETEADGIELNFGCPHGMSERGMGAAVGQVPEYVEMVVRWCKQYTRMPVITKLTPNVTDVRRPARAAKNGGTDAVSLINTINSITGVDLDTCSPTPSIDGKGTHGGYCGPAVKPIALNMVAEIARDPETYGLPISGIGGVTTWRDAAEFLMLGAGNVQVCTAAMTYGFKIVQEMITGLEAWMDEKGYATLDDFRGKAVPNVTDWQYLNLNYIAKAHIDQDACIKCGRCHIACEDTSTRRSPTWSTACATSRSSKRNASPAISASTSARSRTASPWSKSSLARSTSAPARSCLPSMPTGRRIRTTRWRRSPRSEEIGLREQRGLRKRGPSFLSCLYAEVGRRLPHPPPPLWGRWRQPEGDFAKTAEVRGKKKAPLQPSPQGGGRAAVAVASIALLCLPLEQPQRHERMAQCPAGADGGGDHGGFGEFFGTRSCLRCGLRVDVEAVGALRGERHGERNQFAILARDLAVVAFAGMVEGEEGLGLCRGKACQMRDGQKVLRFLIGGHDLTSPDIRAAAGGRGAALPSRPAGIGQALRLSRRSSSRAGRA